MSQNDTSTDIENTRPRINGFEISCCIIPVSGCVSMIAIFVLVSLPQCLVWTLQREHKIVGLPKVFSLDTNIDSSEMTGQWVIEDPYYLNELRLLDWREMKLFLETDGICRLENPRHEILNALAPAVEDDIQEFLSQDLHGTWKLSNGIVSLRFNIGEKLLPIEAQTVKTTSNEYSTGIKLLMELNEDGPGGIIWKKMNDPTE